MAEPEELGLVEDLDADEESPYLRRQKALGVQRRTRRRLRWVLFAALVLVPVGALGCFLGLYVLSSPRFALTSPDDVVVTANHFVSRAEILSAVGVPAVATAGRGMNIFRMGLEEKRKQIESLPWVRSATLMRAYPHRLAVHIVERIPVAWANIGGQVKLIDGEGALLDKPEGATFDFPVLMGLDAVEQPAERRLRVALYEEFSQQVEPEMTPSGWLVSEVDLGDVDDLKALLVQAGESLRVHFGQSEFRQRFHNFLTLLPEIRKTQVRIDTVDLRYHNQVVVTPAAAPAENAPATETVASSATSKP
jgi:cell division septal protein FtsQ